ncbi:MAG TPA: 2'-5' RNA ligase family protein [Gaiellaceae bacterium]|nr:2'-5' RNA ligase family protein [Gaiellaceae bacterium]
MSSELQHYLVVPFPELANVVEPWLERSTGSKPSGGVPAHVTLLAPCPDDAEAIADVLDGTRAFAVEFPQLRRFAATSTLYLAPEPAQPFVALTEALVARFPDWPPYGGIHDAVVPHMTVTQGPARDEAEAALAPALPLRGRACEAVLLVEVEPGRFEQAARFPFLES